VSLAAKEAAVVSEIEELPKLISAIRALFAKPPSAGLGSSNNHFDRVNIVNEVRTLFPMARFSDQARSFNIRVLEVDNGK
jgi:hypothetical protein